MAITDESNGFYMPVAPAYGNGGGFGGGFGGDWGWIILLLLCGWGGMGFGGMGGWGMGGFGGYDFPWILNGQNNLSNQMSSGFRDTMINDGINSIGDKVTSGFGDVQTALCGGFAGVNATVNNVGTGITNRLYDNEIASLNRSFAVESALQNCCCENRAATADLKYTLASEACATRAANTQNTQAILDKLCALELDGVKAQVAAEQRENANLRSELMYARGQASQIEQTAALKAGQAAEVDALYNRLKNCPVGTFSVCNPNIYPGQSTCPCSGGFAN